MLDPGLRSQRARIAALSQHAAGRTNTAPAREAFNERFRRQVEELAAEKGETLTDAEITRRAEFARRLHFARLAFASSRARTSKAGRSKKGAAVSTSAAPKEAGEDGADTRPAA